METLGVNLPQTVFGYNCSIELNKLMPKAKSSFSPIDLSQLLTNQPDGRYYDVLGRGVGFKKGNEWFIIAYIDICEKKTIYSSTIYSNIDDVEKLELFSENFTKLDIRTRRLLKTSFEIHRPRRPFYSRSQKRLSIAEFESLVVVGRNAETTIYAFKEALDQNQIVFDEVGLNWQFQVCDPLMRLATIDSTKTQKEIIRDSIPFFVSDEVKQTTSALDKISRYPIEYLLMSQGDLLIEAVQEIVDISNGKREDTSVKTVYDVTDPNNVFKVS